MDWTFVSPSTPGINETFPITPLTFELRVTNWAYGVQIDKVHVAAGESLIKIPPYKRTVEFIGDSLSAGMYTSYEGLSSFAYGVGAGLGDTEYYVTAYPGICVSDQDCWGNPRGQAHQWFYASDTSWRASQIWGDEPEPWAFEKQETTPDIVIINLGTNDNNAANNVSTETYVDAYKKLIQGVHGKYPKAQVVVMQLWMGFYSYGNSYQQNLGYEQELKDIVSYFNSDEYLSAPAIWDGTTNTTTVLDTPSESFVHYFSTKGIMQHNDIGPQWHPTDVGAIKVASHLTQFIKLTFGWELVATGPELGEIEIRIFAIVSVHAAFLADGGVNGSRLALQKTYDLHRLDRGYPNKGLPADMMCYIAARANVIDGCPGYPQGVAASSGGALADATALLL
ncbi:putative acetylxylan esterase protein [Daldinia childiae]|uniref:putative acetylxylan esterase protein n=1 Tax=Daldinia childiae TaxID=326645 RepID=UPI001446A6D0|nr:putative acetylxylan esterase protein [Daldinia childiae]KAF3055032.1 putative acetylxylan esterase protein [Daldinia childiae]